MKKIIFLTLAISGLAFTSCKKCQTCTVTTNQEVSGVTIQSSQQIDEFCGDNYDSAPEPGTVTQNLGVINQSVTTSCTD